MNNQKKNDIGELIDFDVSTLEIGSNLQLPSPEVVQYYRDENERRIFIVSDVSEDLIEYEKLILRWNFEDEKNNIPVDERKPIKIFLYSYGGDGNVCLSFIDIMKISKTPIQVFCIGVAMSAAAIIFVCAPKGNRYMLKNSTILLHQGSSNSAGTAQAVLDQAEDYKHFLEILKNVILDNTNITKTQYTKMSKKEWYIYSDKAIELGIADHIIDNIEQLM